MKKVNFFKTKIFTLLLIVLIAVMALSVTGCKVMEETPQSSNDSNVTGSVDTESSQDTSKVVSATELGQGSKYFVFNVEVDGNCKVYNIKTDKDTVGDALTELGLISGEQGLYGLYVKTVDGLTLDYDKDKAYWSFYEDGNYAMTGVDKTEIVNGKNYGFKKEKA
jgi:hypothetical protein